MINKQDKYYPFKLMDGIDYDNQDKSNVIIIPSCNTNKPVQQSEVFTKVVYCNEFLNNE